MPRFYRQLSGRARFKDPNLVWRAWTLRDRPGIAGAQERVERLGTELVARALQLVRHRLREDRPLDGAKHSDRGGAGGTRGELSELEGLARIRVSRIVDHDLLLA